MTLSRPLTPMERRVVRALLREPGLSIPDLLEARGLLSVAQFDVRQALVSLERAGLVRRDRDHTPQQPDRWFAEDGVQALLD